MTKQRFAMGLAFASILLASCPASAGQAEEPADVPLKAGKPINTGEVLSGELNTLRVHDAKGKRLARDLKGRDPLTLAERALQSRDRTGDVRTRHHQRRAGQSAEIAGGEGSLDQGRRDCLRRGRGADERGRDHQMEFGEALNRTVIARLDRGPSIQCLTSLEYWITRLRG